MAESAITVAAFQVQSDDSNSVKNAASDAAAPRRPKRKGTPRRSTTSDETESPASVLDSSTTPKYPPLTIIPVTMVPTTPITIISPPPPLHSMVTSLGNARQISTFALIPVRTSGIPTVTTPILKPKLRVLRPSTAATAAVQTAKSQITTAFGQRRGENGSILAMDQNDQNRLSVSVNDRSQASILSNNQKQDSQKVSGASARKKMKPARAQVAGTLESKEQLHPVEEVGAPSVADSSSSGKVTLPERIHFLEKRLEEVVGDYETRIKKLEEEVTRLEVQLESKSSSSSSADG